ncbi:MAG TPA: AsmA family protein, partial [Bryobacteraceae bacterium]|nr:AsmA family protein [Bryobacteraceae bacterium]
MRKLLIVIGIVAALLIAAVFAIPALLDVNRYRGQIQAALEGRLNRGVTLGAMSLKVIPLAFSVQNVVIKEDPQFPVERPFAQVRELSVSPRFWPLLRGDVEIRSLTLERPVIELVKNASGIWNTSTLGGSQSRANVAPHSDPPKERDFSLARLEIHDGQLAVTDLQKRRPRAIYDHIDLTLNDYAPGKAFSLVTTAHLPGKGANELKLEGQGGPVVQGDMARTPFQGTVVIKEVS